MLTPRPRRTKKLKCVNSRSNVIALAAKGGVLERCMVGRWCLGKGRLVFSFFCFFVDFGLRILKYVQELFFCTRGDMGEGRRGEDWFELSLIRILWVFLL